MATAEIVVKRRRMHPGQIRLTSSKARYRVAMFGRRWGKNVVAEDEAMTRALNGQAVGWGEPSYKYLLEPWRDLCSRLRPAAKHISEQEKRIELVTGGLIEMWTLDNPDAGRSRAYDHFIVNEAGIVRGLMALWEQAIRPTLTDRAGSALFLGTPKGRTHDFSLLFAKAEGGGDWEAFRGPTAENPYIPRSEIAAAKRELPPAIFAQEYEGIPADDGGNPFGLDAIRESVGELSTDPVVCWGWDFARAQDFLVGVGLDRLYRVAAFHRWQLKPWGESKALVHQLTKAPAWGDSTGIGDVIVEDLQRMGTPMQGYKFTPASKQQLMERLAAALQQGLVKIPDGVMRSELESFGFEYTAHGVRYSAPEGLHDDCVMALALAVYGRDQYGHIPAPPGPVVNDDDTHPGFDFAQAERKRRFLGYEEEAPRGWRNKGPAVRLEDE